MLFSFHKSDLAPADDGTAMPRVLPYALSVIEDVVIAPGDLPAAESFLIKASVVAPVSLDRICSVILDMQNRTKALSAKRIGQRFLHLAEVALEKGHGFEVI